MKSVLLILASVASLFAATAHAAGTSEISCVAKAKRGATTITYEVVGYAIVSHGIPGPHFQYGGFTLSIRPSTGAAWLQGATLELVGESFGQALFEVPSKRISAHYNDLTKKVEIIHDTSADPEQPAILTTTESRCSITEVG